MEVSRCCFAAVMQQKQQLHVSRCCFAAVCVEKLRLEISSYKDADQLEGLDLFSELVDVISADRDGVSGSQFTQVLNIELDQIIEASKFLDGKWSPKFTVIVAQENHHTRFFQSGHPENVPPGHIVTYRLSCSNDEIGFSANDLHELVHFLSSVYKRSTTAVSVVAPICHTCLAVAHMSQFIKFNEMFDTSFSHDGEHLSRDTKLKSFRIFMDFKTTEFIEKQDKPLKMDKLEQAAARVDRILEAATWEVKLNDMVSSKKIKEDEAVKLAIPGLTFGFGFGLGLVFVMVIPFAKCQTCYDADMTRLMSISASFLLQQFLKPCLAEEYRVVLCGTGGSRTGTLLADVTLL
ncbi:hypothetical protein KPL71_014870 [Citrus sinensis]|uniref:Uncharacterized protein n=1 Tax=Citrus sinensis TaxID=2711 RepID=A0ACB8KEU1_CITSI|nr:hypothetical protein KPL71_014870 [Citrus sinensis]